MKTQLLPLVCAVVLAAGTQQTPTLDLTQPSETVRSGSVPGISSVGTSPLIIALVEPLDQTYVAGEPFVYEVTITNPSGLTQTIPWSEDASWANGRSGASVFESSILIEFGNATSGFFFGDVAAMYGDPVSPNSVQSIAPGATVRVRARGDWFAGNLNLRQFLSQTQGRIGLRAKYQILRGTHLESTVPSNVREVTLELPPVDHHAPASVGR